MTALPSSPEVEAAWQNLADPRRVSQHASDGLALIAATRAAVIAELAQGAEESDMADLLDNLYRYTCYQGGADKESEEEDEATARIKLTELAILARFAAQAQTIAALQRRAEEAELHGDISDRRLQQVIHMLDGSRMDATRLREALEGLLAAADYHADEPVHMQMKLSYIAYTTLEKARAALAAPSEEEK